VNDISGWRKEGERGTVKCRFHPRGFSFMRFKKKAPSQSKLCALFDSHAVSYLISQVREAADCLLWSKAFRQRRSFSAKNCY
jgi:hypothetical protein